MQHGWDRFLTEQDKSLLAATRWAKGSAFGLGRTPALVIVDAYYGSVGPVRKPILDVVEEWPSACGEVGWEAIDATVPVLEEARRSGVPVYFLTGLAAGSSPWNRKKTSAAARKPDPRFLQIVDELRPHEGETVLEKCSPSGFTTTGLDLLLRSAGVDTILICGEATSGCVRATVVDACVAGYAVGVVEDCCFDRVEASHWVNLFDMNQKYADVIDSSRAIDYLRRPAPTGAAGVTA